MNTVARLFLLAGSVLTLAGCNGVGVLDPVRRGPFYTPKNFSGQVSLGGIRRVVLLPIYGGTVAPAEMVAGLDSVFVEALQGENRFEVVTLSREDCQHKFRATEFCSTAALPHGLLPRLKEDLAVDAVLFVDLTAFNSYRPLTIGLRAKLASIDGTILIWSFDNMFAADDPTVVNAARRHFLGGDQPGVPVDLTPGVLQSPVRFAGYAAAAMFATLPPVVPPPAPPTKRARR